MEFLFDVKLFASLRIEADNLDDAKAKIDTYLNYATADFGRDKRGKPLLTDVPLDTEDGAELMEIDGV